MKKISLELPKYRLQMHLHLVKRRKPLLSEPLIPSIKTVKRKYRKGSMTGRYFRHIFEHKWTKKLISSAFAIAVISTTFIPQTGVYAEETLSPELIIHSQTVLTTEKSIQYPLKNIRINQNFSFFHPGIDFGGPIGEVVSPIKKGKVVFAGYTKDGYGNNVVVDHGQGIQSLYAHLSTIEVDIDQEVGTETKIGQVGRSGRTTGPHLHLEVRQNGRNINPFSIISR
jgi:murein DD-endopeptidase MepM/ murein hydrolase activator NlpD